MLALLQVGALQLTLHVRHLPYKARDGVVREDVYPPLKRVEVADVRRDDLRVCGVEVGRHRIA